MAPFAALCEVPAEFRSPANKCNFLHSNMRCVNSPRVVSGHALPQTGILYYENLWIKTKYSGSGEYPFIYKGKILLK
jgi:hypothetical protein